MPHPNNRDTIKFVSFKRNDSIYVQVEEQKYPSPPLCKILNFFSSEWIFNGFILFHSIVIMILIGLPKQNLCTSDSPYSLTDFPRSDLHVSFPFSSKLFDLKSGGSQLQGHILDLHCQLS